jgi:hypothetical protein
MNYFHLLEGLYQVVHNYILVDAIFDRDYEFDILFIEKCNKKSKIVRYKPVWA